MRRLLFLILFQCSVMLSVVAQVQLINNGNFATLTAWTMSGDFHYNSQFTCCRSCPGYAYVSDANGNSMNNASGFIAQPISIPANTTSATLSFYYSISTQETGTTANDKLHVFFWDNVNSLPSVVTLSNVNKTGNATGCNPYVQYTYNLPSSLFGRNIELHFGTQTNGTLPTVFRVDDVSLLATVSSGGTGSGSVKVTLQPSAAITDGAMWNLDGGGWRSSGTTVTGVSTGNHTVNFNTISGWTRPSSRNINITNGNTSNITGTYTLNSGNNHDVSGTVRLNGSALNGVNIIANPGNYQTTTNISGDYSFSLPDGWSGTITPSSTSYSFIPGSRSHVNLSTDQSNENFTATVLATTYTISGKVTENGGALQGVGITGNPGGYFTSTSTQGEYTLTIPAAWSGTISPSKGNYSFTPADRNYNAVSSNLSEQNYIGTPQPTINSITFTNVIENHPGIPQNFTLYTGSASSVNQPVKICADGSTATYIALNVSNTTGISFKIVDEFGQNVNGEDLYGKLGTPYTFNGNTIEVAYTHPQYMNADALFRSLKLKVYFNGVAISGVAFPLEIYRAPIAFVHGLYGQRSTFEKVSTRLLSKNWYPTTQNGKSPLIQLVDYSSTNGNSFKSNRKVVPSNIDNILLNARANKFSTSKIDLIGHSMGGLLSRFYLQGTWRGTPYRNDIHKMITVNSPHFGSQFANLIEPLSIGVTLAGFALDWNITTHVLKNVVLNLTGYNGTGALFDLQVDSKEIENLNVAVSLQNIVPSHTISTTKLLSDVHSGSESMARAAKFVLTHVDVFKGEAHDLIVPLSSQKSNFSWPASSHDQFHVGSSNNDNVISKLELLVNANPFDNVMFSRSGFQPGQLSVRQVALSPLRSHSTDTIYFLSPLRNAEFNYDDSIPVTIHGTAGIKAMLLIENMHDSGSVLIDTTVSILSTKILPRSRKIGKIQMAVLGATDNNVSHADTTSIYINPPTDIIDLDVAPDTIEMHLGETVFLKINAIYADKILGVENVNDMVIFTDTSKIAYLGNGRLVAKNVFNSICVFRWHGKSDTIYVKVNNSSDHNIASFRYDKFRICETGIVKFYDESRGVISSRQWKFQGGIPENSTEINPVIAYPSPGLYKVSLVTNFVNSSDTLMIDSLIQVYHKPSPKISGSNQICSGTSTSLDAGPGFSKYVWSTGATTRMIQYAVSGPVWVTVTNEHGCSNADTFHLTVLPPVIPTVNLSASDFSVCAGQSLQVFAYPENGGATPLYQWYLNGNPVGNNSATYTSPVLTTETKIYCKMTSNAYCANPNTVSSEVKTIIVHPIVTPAITISVAPGVSVCAGERLTFTASVLNQGATPVYQWFVNGSAVGTNNPSFSTTSLSDASKVTCRLMSNAKCLSTPIAFSNPVNVTIHSLPKVFAGADYLLAKGSSAFLGVDAKITATEPYTFVWTPSTGLNNNTIIRPLATPYWSTSYTLEVTDKFGCANKDSITVGISGFYFYPNPVRNVLTLKGTNIENGNYLITVTNIYGQVVYSRVENIVNQFMFRQIDMKRMPAGVYAVNISGNSLFPFAEKVIKVE